MEANTIKENENYRMFDIGSLELINQMAQVLPQILNLKQVDENEFIDDIQAAKMLGVKKSTLHAMTSKRVLTYYQPCKANLFKKAEIVAYIEASKRPSRAAIIENVEMPSKEKTKVTSRISRRDRTWNQSKMA